MHGPGSYAVETNWPAPSPPKDWVLLKVRYAGICGSDLTRFARTGSYRHPMILGHEFAGVVEQDSPVFKAGTPVAVLPLIPCGECSGCRNGMPFHCRSYQFLGSRNDGGFAEYCAVPEENLFPLHASIDMRRGALLEPLSVALHVVRRSGFTKGARALVFGAGPIGLLTVLWLRHFGASHITVADIRDESREAARRLGNAIDRIVDPLADEFDNFFDVSIEAAGANPALLGAIRMTRPAGALAIVGRDTRDTVLPLDVFEALMRKELDVHGCWGYDLRGEEELVAEALRDFPLDELITREVPLDSAANAVNAMINGESYACKVLIRM